MKVKTGIKAGSVSIPTSAPGQVPVRAVRVKTGIKAGCIQLPNHNEAQGGLKVKTGIKAGANMNHNEAQARSA